MTLRHITIFLEVYKQMNITRAAEQLHMTQPAVTRAIQEIEHYYNVKLFDRLNHRIYATESAHTLYRYAVHIQDTYDEMDKLLSDWDEVGVLRVGATITIGNYDLPRLVSLLHSEHEQMDIRALVARGEKIERALNENTLDIALIEGVIRSDELKRICYSHDKLCLILPPGHPLTQKSQVLLQDLTKCPLLLREDGSAGRTYLEMTFGAHGLSITPAWESASTQALVRAVACNLGISVLPEKLVEDDVMRGTVVTCPIADAPLVRDLHIVWHRNKFLSPAARRFIKLVQKTAP